MHPYWLDYLTDFEIPNPGTTIPKGGMMGEMAEMAMEGALCETCGDFLDGEAPGYPRRCETCKAFDRKQAKRPRRPSGE